MTKKDFALIADVINRMVEDTNEDIERKRYVATCFADRLKLVNPLFKRELFFKACGF